jgi:hypothetical protein
MSLNRGVGLSMPVNPETWGQGVEREKNNSILVSESSYPMDNVPTRQTTIQSYALELEGNELIPRHNAIYNGLRGAEERVYVSPSTG